MSIAKEINTVLVACDKVPLAKRDSLWVQAWDAARSAAAAHKNYKHDTTRTFLRVAQNNLKAHKEKHK